MADIPEVQQLGAAVLLSGLALFDVHRFLVRGITEVKRQDGISPHPRLLHLVDAIKAARAAGEVMARNGQRDVADDTHQSDWVKDRKDIGTTTAAQILGLSSRQVQRIARSLGGRQSPSGTWIFERLAVEAYGHERTGQHR